MSTIEQTLLRLQKSAFRAKFHLSEQNRQYIMDIRCLLRSMLVPAAVAAA